MQKCYKNPIIECSEKNNTSDPYVVRHKGFYYHCYANEEGVFITKSSTLSRIGIYSPLKVYDSREPAALKSWFAPELHYIDGSWYIYGAPDYGNGKHVMSVLVCEGDNPMGQYTYKGQMRGLENVWSIDGTPFYYKNKWWFSWANCYKLYLAEMDGPLGIVGKKLVLSTPEYEFEKRESPVNEGSAALIHNGKLFIVYSASDSKYDGYCLGLLEFLGDSAEEMLKTEKWLKYTSPVFEKTDDIFGPGHCSFTKVTDDAGEDQDYIVYHANLVSGTGWTGRSVWTQKFDFDENGKPVFGNPQKEYKE